MPELLTDWFDYLPRDFLCIDAVYPTTNNDIVLITNTSVYIINFSNLQRNNHLKIRQLVGKKNILSHKTPSNNQGNTLLLNDNSYVFRYNKCSVVGLYEGRITDLYKGIPTTLKGVFR